MQNLKSIFFVAIILFSGAYATSASSSVLNEKLKTVEVKVKGITCGMEPAAIAKEVVKIEGVNSCELKGKAKAKSVFVVTYDADKVELSKIRKVIEGTESCDSPGVYPFSVVGK